MEVEYSHSDHLSSIRRGSSSKFKGVILLNGGKWGTRISHRYKSYWLGAYQTEEEAAMAYNRASIKLHRSDAPLNFTWTNDITQESIFQSQYSTEKVLNMIKNKTYSSKFTNFMSSSSHCSVKGTQECNFLFQKKLTPTDVTKRNFLIPKEYALQYFPSLSMTNSDGNEEWGKSIKLTFYDKHRRPWTFRYSYWRSSRSFVFTSGWRHFVNMNNLNHEDIVLFYRCKFENERVFHMIDVDKSSLGNTVVGGNMELENDFKENINNGGLEVDGTREEEMNKGVMLFGVQIG